MLEVRAAVVRPVVRASVIRQHDGRLLDAISRLGRHGTAQALRAPAHRDESGVDLDVLQHHRPPLNAEALYQRDEFGGSCTPPIEPQSGRGGSRWSALPQRRNAQHDHDADQRANERRDADSDGNRREGVDERLRNPTAGVVRRRIELLARARRVQPAAAAWRGAGCPLFP